MLRSLSLIVEGGKPIALGLGVLADHYPAFWFRRRLRGTYSYVQSGVHWIEALKRHGVITLRMPLFSLQPNRSATWPGHWRSLQKRPSADSPAGFRYWFKRSFRW